MHPWFKPAGTGVAGSLILLLAYFAILTLVSGWKFTLSPVPTSRSRHCPGKATRRVGTIAKAFSASRPQRLCPISLSCISAG